MNELLEKIKKIINPLIIFLLIFIMFLMLDDILGKSILEGSVYKSYELQVEAWFNGHTYLAHDYSYLELAIYNGHYYVSFPPFPSVFLVPFYIIFSNDIPANLISFFLFSFEFVIIYKLLKEHKTSEINSIPLASSITIGSNLLSLSIDSGVWFFAQLMNNLLCILSINAFVKKKKTLSYLFLGLAVGCRPFSAIYILMFFIYYIITENDKKLSKRIIDNIVPLIPTMFIGIAYMIYNYIRFDNIFEFGHNYLPEFINAEYGQFSFHYLFDNLKSLFFNRISFDRRLNISFGMPFSFLIANPIFIVYYFRSIKNIIKERKINYFRILIFIFTFLNIILICMHRTLGAWQFGARYTCDILPFILLGIVWKTNRKGEIEKTELNLFEIVCIIIGVILNIFGVILMYTNNLY